jgi:rubredoxin/flavin reductase (DIM6/NTAB) family NADH-FMN oxidoreductase RutF
MNPAALYKISYGLYVIGSVKDGRFNGQIANTVVQVTAEPAQVTIALNQQNLTHDYVVDSGVFSASILAQITPMTFIGRFGFASGRDADKFDGVAFHTGQTGAPIVTENTIAWLEARVSNRIDVGTHTIFVGELVDAQVINDYEPLTYAYYHLIKGGKSPKNAPTYQKAVSEDTGAGVWKCKICGYVYDPQKGDPEAGIKPGTPFADLPDNWRCPVCKAPKTEFEAPTEIGRSFKCKVCGYVYDPKKGDPEAGIQPGTAFADLPDDWRCPICKAPKTEFSQE